MTKKAGIEELRAVVAEADRCVPSVSKWSIGMHVHHCGLAMTGICRLLAAAGGMRT